MLCTEGMFTVLTFFIVAVSSTEFAWFFLRECVIPYFDENVI